MKNSDKEKKINGSSAERSIPEVITLYDRMRKTPDHSFLNFLYVLLFIASCGCALWQHGDVYLTACLMCAAPLMYCFLLIPYRIFPSLWKGILNGLYFSGIILWGIYRLRSVLPDLVLVECLSAACMVFLSGGSARDRGYLFFISVFLTIYGGLIPRTAFLYFGTASLMMLCVILFFQRSASLAGTACRREKKIRWGARILPCVLLLAGTVLGFRYIFALMPVRDNEIPGYFQTSFLTERDNALPVELQKWFQFRKIRFVREVSTNQEAPVLAELEKSKQPPVVSKQGKKANIPQQAEQDSDLIDGNGHGSGAAPPGRDLLFYVKSPALLYHQVRLYDAYDGRSWKESPQIRKLRTHSSSVEQSVIVEQHYTVVKMNSLQLCGGFEMREIYVAADENARIPERILQKAPYRAYLETAPALPFRYVVSAEISNQTVKNVIRTVKEEFTGMPEEEKILPGSRKNKDPFWRENLPKALYLKLPRKRISHRVRDLAEKITGECRTPYEKAVALRDYLRSHYTYTLCSGKVPAGKEGCDYFLFELKKGHCEYFACALAVLARCAGLPARVATGYSPGNYNTLTRMFEVHEYHAHAWTQIYIEKMGWLTMDATPPSDLNTEVLPRGLGHLRDPFGEEWKITPPELTKSSQDVFKENYMKIFHKQEKKPPVIDQALLQAVKTQEKVEQKVRSEYAKTVKKVQKSNTSEKGKLYRLRSFFRESLQKLVRGFYSGCDFFYSMWLILLTGGLLLVVLYKFIKMLVFEICRKNRFRKIRLLEEEGKRFLCGRKDPRQAVICFYRAFRLLLLCTGRDRSENQELLELSEDLGRISTVLGENARGLFLLFYRAEYGNSPMTSAEGEMAQQYFSAGKKKILELFYGPDKT